MAVWQSCAERLALERQVSDAVRRVYAVLGQLDACKRGKSTTELLDRLYSDLDAARFDESRAEDRYREHIKEHACTHDRAFQAHA